ncbi:MAG: hypothetical protein HFF17_04795 [Oscillospiraceae bacterium]|nr:hypothetical protein [Oscillospiraceae bacterium]
MPKQTWNKQGNPQTRGIVMGGCLSLLLLLAVPALGSILILRGSIPEGAAWAVSAAAVLLAAFLGPMPIIGAVRKKPMPVALLHMTALLALMLLCKLIFWPEAPFGNWAVVGAALLGAILAGVVRSKQPRRRR